jgi:hypothetical protein
LEPGPVATVCPVAGVGVGAADAPVLADGATEGVDDALAVGVVPGLPLPGPPALLAGEDEPLHAVTRATTTPSVRTPDTLCIRRG